MSLRAFIQSWLPENRIRPASALPQRSLTGCLRIAALCLLLGQSARSTSITLTNGTSWTNTVGVYSIQVECWGAGGAGGSANKIGVSSWGGGGAGGAYARKASVPVTPGSSYVYSIGAGGTNVSAVDGTRVNGGDTTFTGDSGSVVTASGGQGGASAINTGGGAAGVGSTTGCVGDVGAVFSGGNGAAGATSYGGGGGGGAGDANAGGNASTNTAGLGGVNGGGAGGNGATTGAPGSPGSAPGGGGGGARMTGTAGLQAGGTGASGQVIITYTTGVCTAATASTPTGNGAGTGGLTVCQGSTITLTETPGAGTPPFNYQWNSNGIPVSNATNSTCLISAPVNGDQYTCVVTARCGGAVSTSPAATLVVTALAAAPGQPSATALPCNPVTVSWGAVNGAISYNVYRKVSGGSYGLAITNTTGTSCLDSDNLSLSNGSTYVYAVSSVSGCGTESARSGDSSGVTPTVAPAITSSPASVTNRFGLRPTFTVVALNTTSYQWQVNKGGGFVNAVEVTDGTGSGTASFRTVPTTPGMNGYQYRCVASGSCSPAATSATATLTVMADTLANLQTAIENANPGDVLILADGTYTNNIISIPSSKSNITVRSATPGGVFLNGTNDITIDGNNNTFSGFQFVSASVSDSNAIPIFVYGTSNLLTQLNFNGYVAQKYINLQGGGQYNQVTYCNFQNKPTNAPKGNLIHIDPDLNIPGYHKIRYCSFQNMPGAGGDNGNECIRISNGATSNYVSRTVVEYCYFNNTGLGDSEEISVKCRENVLRYNTCTNNQNAMMCFRNGDSNVAYGNFFINAGGLRVKEANHVFCYNNYFQSSGVSGTMGSVLYVVEPGNTNALHDVNFLYNTFVECGTIDFDSASTFKTSNTWANNIFKKTSASGNIFSGSASGISWAGNIYSNKSLGISIPSGMVLADPKLVLNSDRYYGLASNSAAIDASSTNFPAILNIAGVDDDPSLLLDISGQSRPTIVTNKDVGSDEFGTNGTLNRPLELSDVGPSYLGGPVSAVPPSITTQPLSQAVNVGSNVTFTVIVAGDAPLAYQWRFNGTNLAGATATNYSIAPVQRAHAGDYTVVVTNVAGSVTSAVATLTVQAMPPQYTNYSVGIDKSLVLFGTGPVGEAYRIFTTTNLSLAFSNWTVVATGLFNGGVFNFTDPQTTNYSSRFYRVTTP